MLNKILKQVLMTAVRVWFGFNDFNLNFKNINNGSFLNSILTVCNIKNFFKNMKPTTVTNDRTQDVIPCSHLLVLKFLLPPPLKIQLLAHRS
jgi:hypothetical protein